MGKPKAKRTMPGVGAGLASTPVDLFLLAGIPNPLNVGIKEFLKKKAGTTAEVVTVSSKSYERPLYRDATVQSLLRAAGQFSVKRLRNQAADPPPRPRRLALFYVPSTDEDLLLKAFDFFIFPVPLRELADFDDRGHQKRHDRASCEGAVITALQVYRTELINCVQPRIEARRPSEQLLLPPRNFHLPESVIGSFFHELTRRTRLWGDCAHSNMKSEFFAHEQLPKYLGHQARITLFRDARNVVFPCAKATQLHWRLPELGRDSEIVQFQQFLRSTYRFGAPLPDGFHHDAQLEWGKEFDDMKFDCSSQGEVKVSGSHVNIYPNDFIRKEV